jgi:hypothetical protein
VLSDLGVGRLVVVGAETDSTEDQTESGAPPPDQVIAHTNMSRAHQTAPGRTAGTVDSTDVDFRDPLARESPARARPQPR